MPGACDCHTHIFGSAKTYPMVLPRSYTPEVATLEDYKQLTSRLGINRVVLVQPSVYGTDNTCMLDAMRVLGDRARGVAVLAEIISDLELESFSRAGIRAVRINAATHGVTDVTQLRSDIRRWSDRIASLGWHIQLFLELPVLADVSDLLTTLATPVVIDHAGLATASLGTGQPGFESLLELLRSGNGWVKISAIERITKGAGLESAEPIVQALAATNPARIIWGSDWPHTPYHSGNASSDPPVLGFRNVDERLHLGLIKRWVGETAFEDILVHNPASLYGFPPVNASSPPSAIVSMH